MGSRGGFLTPETTLSQSKGSSSSFCSFPGAGAQSRVSSQGCLVAVGKILPTVASLPGAATCYELAVGTIGRHLENWLLARRSECLRNWLCLCMLEAFLPVGADSEDWLT